MRYYGYEAGRYTPDYSFIALAGQQLSKIPEVVELDAALKERKVTNNDTYSALELAANGIDDDEFQSAFGMDKQSWLKLARPGKNEKPEMYAVRSVKLLEPYQKVISKQNIGKAVAEIQAKNAPYGEAVAGPLSEGTPMGDIEAVQRLGGGEAPQAATPAEIGAIGQKYGVSPEQLAPQMKEAETAQTRSQLGKVDPRGTRFEGYQAIGGGATGESKEALSAVPTAKQTEDANWRKTNQELERDKLNLRRTDQELRRMSILLRDAHTKQKAIDTIDNRSLKVEERLLKLRQQKENLDIEGRETTDEYGQKTFVTDAISRQQSENIQNIILQYQNMLQKLQNAKTSKWVGPTPMQRPEYKESYSPTKKLQQKKPKKKTSSILSEFEAWKRGR